MARRLHQTLADYVVIAISPALIMALVGSLMFFLLRVFYQGQFQERLHFVMACFVFAAVLIGRISIAEGFERAAPFGAVLGILVGIAANRFMEYQGTWVDSYGWIINFTVIGIVWWCAHQLTWDCTVIDESQDASGEGLMQVVGLERPKDERNQVVDQERLAGSTSRQVPTGFWQRYVEHQRRPHAPGVWVVYFSLAALPIFGLGQWLIPASDTGGRRYVFWLLCIYVASGLGLLLTTSFLGLRRYLRQRRIEMPTMMANLWLTTGAAIIGSLIIAAALLPRPSAEFAVSQLPFTLGSPEQDASRHAPSPKDGTQDDHAAPAAEPDTENDTGDAPPEGAGNQPGGQSSEGNPSAGSEGQPSGSDSGEGKPGGEDKADDKSGGQSSNEQNKGPESSSGDGRQSSQRDRAESRGDSQNQGQQSESDRSQAQKSQSSEQNDEDANDQSSDSEFVRNLKKYREQQEQLAAPYKDKPPEADQSQAADPDSADSAPEEGEPPQPSELPLSLPMTILKYLFYAAFVLGVLFVMWRYRQEALQAIRNFLAELRAWWRSLWGSKRDYGLADEGPIEVRVPPRPFASFTDPFLTGAAARQSPEELVRYSFEAFEAWSREHGCERTQEQTPHEFVRDVARLNAAIAGDARALAELYARAAFARGRLSRETNQQLEHLWRQMARGATAVSELTGSDA